MEVKAIKDSVYKSQRQWLSGFHVGYEREDVWRFQIEMSTQPVLSSRTYADAEKAMKAGKRFVEKLLK